MTELQKKAKARKEYIRKCISKGMTYRLIGEKLGISRQRVHQLFRGYRFVLSENVTLSTGKDLTKDEVKK